MIRSAIRRAANALLTAELVALVAFAALCFGSLPFGLATYGVMTGSMEPAIHTGDLAYVDTRVTGEDVSPGDVIAFDIGDGQTCTHRVVSVDEEAREITTKGDANGSPDAFPVAFDRVRGRTVGSVPLAGDVLLSITENRVPWILAVGSVLALTYALTCVPAGRAKTKSKQKGKEDGTDQPDDRDGAGRPRAEAS